MSIKLKIPEEVIVGYQKRKDTYEDKLGFITFKEKNVLRKEHSWNKWRDESIEPDTFKNEPTEGFVLNKQIGGYKTEWSFKQSKIRLYDPRGFEIEITIENLMHILSYNGCVPGKGLEGTFVYAWEGKDVWLISCKSPEYLNTLSKQNEKNEYSLTTKNVQIGFTYIDKNNDEFIYLGHIQKYNNSNEPILDVTSGKFSIKTKKAQKTHMFYNVKKSSVVTKKLSDMYGLKSNEVDEVLLTNALKKLYKNDSFYSYSLSKENHLKSRSNLIDLFKKMFTRYSYYHGYNQSEFTVFNTHILFDENKDAKYFIQIRQERIDKEEFLNLYVFDKYSLEDNYNKEYKMLVLEHPVFKMELNKKEKNNRFLNTNISKLYEELLKSEELISLIEDSFIHVYKRNLENEYAIPMEIDFYLFQERKISIK